MEPIRFFDSMEHLEPRCPTCNCIIKYGLNTTFDDKKLAHRCNGCNTLLK